MFGSIERLAARIRGLDVSGLDSVSVQAAMAALGRARGALDATEARLVARADELAARGEGAGGHEELTREGTLSGREARKVAERAKLLDQAPALGEALGAGEVGAGHVDAAARATRDLDEQQRHALLGDADVVDAARRMPVEGFARFVKQRADAVVDETALVDRFERQRGRTRLKKWVNSDGMYVLNGELDPEIGSRLFRAIDTEIETLAQRDSLPKNDHTAAHALAALVERGLGAGPNPTPAEIIVIDIDTLRHGRHEHSTCETSSGAQLPVDTARRACCDAMLAPQLLDPATGVVLDAGRASRVATRAQRRALRAMYPTCAYPGCDRAFDWCQIHHIVPWETGGTTDLANLLPLCTHHHHLIHEGGWRLHLTADRTLTIHQRDGTVHAEAQLPSAELARQLSRRRRSSPPPSEASIQSREHRWSRRPGRAHPHDRPTGQPPPAGPEPVRLS